MWKRNFEFGRKVINLISIPSLNGFLFFKYCRTCGENEGVYRRKKYDFDSNDSRKELIIEDMLNILS